MKRITGLIWVVLLAGMPALLTGCKDFWHPGGPGNSTPNNGNNGGNGGSGETMPAGLSIAGSLEWLASHAQTDASYTITLTADESLAPKTLSAAALNGKTGVSITLKGSGEVRKVYLASAGSLFTIESGVTLILGENLSLLGRTGNTASLVMINSGTVFLQTGAKISGNTTSSNGGGVYVGGGLFTMTGGEISGNTASYGGGVYVASGGAFKKQPAAGSAESGVIRGNAIGGTAAAGEGINVYVSAARKRETTVTATQSLDSAKDGEAGGWDGSEAALSWTPYKGAPWVQGDPLNPTDPDPNCWYSTNKEDSSASWLQLTIEAPVPCTITVTLIAFSEKDADWAYISPLDDDAPSTHYDHRVSGEGNGNGHSISYRYDIPVGTHYFYFGYVKNGSVSKDGDYASVKAVIGY